MFWCGSRGDENLGKDEKIKNFLTLFKEYPKSNTCRRCKDSDHACPN